MSDLIARRLKYARERAKWTQAELARRFGFKDRQTLAAIEAGQRKLTADELVRAVDIFNVDLDFFTDPLRLVGEGRFNWRADKSTDHSSLQSFEDKAGRWIAAYRRFSKRDQESVTTLKPRLPLTVRSSYEEARAAGESLVREWKLGAIPALHLEKCLRERIGALVLHVDPPDVISGAACLLPELSTILVNRREPEGRRHYDLAHEAFHVLTWEQMPPAHAESEIPRGGKGQRVEQLADNFASALLMPEKTLFPKWRARDDMEIHNWLNETATELLVTAVALKWRLVQLGWLTKRDLPYIQDGRLRANGRPGAQQVVPRLFSREFVESLHEAVLGGEISARRTASLLDMSLHDLQDLFRDYDLPSPFEL
ncbi:MAG: XRE family transcriptional regulator [Arenicellales bacterium]